MSNPFDVSSVAEVTVQSGKLRLTRIGILSAGITSAVLSASTTLVVLPFMLLAILLDAGNSGGPAAAVLGVFALLLPVGYGIIGFFGGMLWALIYNITAGLTGGLELDLQPSQ